MNTLHNAPDHYPLHLRINVEKSVAAFITSQFAKAAFPVTIAIGGPGGSGKTTFARVLSKLLPDSGVLNLDNYKTSRAERAEKKLAGPHPEANRMELVKVHLAALKRGEEISVPVYDRESGDTSRHEIFTPRRFILVEGEISTYLELCACIDFSIYLDAELTTQLAARTGRDIHEHGHSFQKAITTFLTSNLNDFLTYGAISKNRCDLHLFCHEDRHITGEAIKTTLFERFRATVTDVAVPALSGCVVPLATPFSDNLKISIPALIEHLDFLNSAGIKNILAGGTTAEFFSLSVEERLHLLKTIREHFSGQILFNISGDSLATTTLLADKGARFGADSLICLPPYYYAGAPAAGIVNYFTSVAAECDLPLYLYNFPKHTGNPITAEMLRHIPHAGLKDSSSDLSLIAATPRYLLGGDSKIVASFKQGAVGFIPGLPNVFPKIYLALHHALVRGNFEAAETLQMTIATIKSQIPKVSGILAVKQILTKIVNSYPVNVRPPLTKEFPQNFDFQALFTLSERTEST